MSGWSIDDLALAYELRQEGCCWKRIAQGIGGDPDGLRFEAKNRIRDGLRDQRRIAPDWAVAAASSMRRDGIGWQSIGAHLRIDAAQLRDRYYKQRRNNGVRDGLK